jgi:hypothetical protein
MVSVQDPQNLVVGQVAAFNLPTSTVAGDGVADFVSGSSTKSSGPVELGEMTVGGEAGVKIRVTRPPQGRERTPKVAVLTPDQIEVVFPPGGGVPTFRFGVSNSKEFPELALWSGKGQLPAEATATTLRLTVKSDSELVVAGGRSQAVSFELIDQVQDVLLNLGSERKVLGEAAAAMKAKKA